MPKISLPICLLLTVINVDDKLFFCVKNAVLFLLHTGENLYSRHKMQVSKQWEFELQKKLVAWKSLTKAAN